MFRWGVKRDHPFPRIQRRNTSAISRYNITIDKPMDWPKQILTSGVLSPRQGMYIWHIEWATTTANLTRHAPSIPSLCYLNLTKQIQNKGNIMTHIRGVQLFNEVSMSGEQLLGFHLDALRTVLFALAFAHLPNPKRWKLDLKLACLVVWFVYTRTAIDNGNWTNGSELESVNAEMAKIFQIKKSQTHFDLFAGENTNLNTI